MARNAKVGSGVSPERALAVLVSGGEAERAGVCVSPPTTSVPATVGLADEVAEGEAIADAEAVALADGDDVAAALTVNACCAESISWLPKCAWAVALFST
jgi:hypothetical protein